jgi:hypothetical protein
MHDRLPWGRLVRSVSGECLFVRSANQVCLYWVTMKGILGGHTRDVCCASKAVRVWLFPVAGQPSGGGRLLRASKLPLTKLAGRLWCT